LATLSLFRDQPVLERVAERAQHLSRALEPLREHPHVAEVRQTGFIAAIEMVRDRATRTPYDWRERRGLAVYRHGLAHGVLLRPLGNVVYFMPPYVIEPEEIDLMVAVATQGIARATAD
jgi:adenosylmethionine-8-amino-7-oxononanoate aminotransferase